MTRSESRLQRVIISRYMSSPTWYNGLGAEMAIVTGLSPLAGRTNTAMHTAKNIHRCAHMLSFSLPHLRHPRYLYKFKLGDFLRFLVSCAYIGGTPTQLRWRAWPPAT